MERPNVIDNVCYMFDIPVDRRGTDCMKYDALEKEFGRSDLIPLWVADMDFPVCEEIVQACYQRLNHSVYGYVHASDSYWKSIIDWQKSRNGFNIEREEITFIPGIVKGISFAVVSLTEPGDKILIQPPVYHPFKRVIEQNGRVAVMNPLKEPKPGSGNNYEMDIEGLRKVVEEERPKMLILCNPHNPIGISWSPEVLREVAEICSEYGVLVVSDEIHGDLVWEGHKHTPFATVSDAAANISITFGAPSKTFNIPGFVSSWCVVKNLDLRQKFFDWLESKELNGLNIMSLTATEAAYSFGADWLRQVKDYISGNIFFVANYIQTFMPKLKVHIPQASFLLWIDCRELGLNHDELIDMLINKAHLALTDGAIFGKEGNGFVRMNVAIARFTLERALKQLDNAINNPEQ